MELIPFDPLTLRRLGRAGLDKYIHYFELIEVVQNEDHWTSAPWKCLRNDKRRHPMTMTCVPWTLVSLTWCWHKKMTVPEPVLRKHLTFHWDHCNRRQALLAYKCLKVTPGFSHFLYIEASSPHAITSAIPLSHQSLVWNINCVPAKDVVVLYSPHKDFASSFWVWIICGTYKNNVGYVLLWNGDKVEILLVPWEHPYDNDCGCKLLFDIEAACWAGCMVERTFDTEVVTCGCLIYQQGLLRQSFVKQILEVVEAPHPNDLAFHHLAGINPPLIQWTITLFLAQLWQEGNLVHILQGEFVDTCGTILAVNMQNKTATIEIDAEDGLKGQYYFLIFHLQCVHRRGDSVKVFAGPDKGAKGFIVALGDSLTVAVGQDGEDIEVSPKSLKWFPRLILE